MDSDLGEILVRSKMSRYLTGRMSLPKFVKWFVPFSWDIHEWASPELCELVYGIDLRLAEYSSGHWTKGQFREKLLPFATSIKPKFEALAGFRLVKPRIQRAPATVSPFPSPRPWREVPPLSSSAGKRLVKEFA